MVVLFLLALLLAWPTFGLSIVVYIAFVATQVYWTARMRIYFADQKQAERDVLNGAKQLPSWANKSSEMELFVEVVLALAIKAGVSPAFVRALFADKQTFDKFLFLAGAMDRRGASITQQKTVAVEKVVDMWERASVEMKNHFLDQDRLDLQAADARNKAASSRSASAKADRSYARGQRFGRAFHKVTRAAYTLWRIVAATAVIATMIYASFMFVTAHLVDGVFVLTMAMFAVVGGTGAAWIMMPGYSGKVRDYEDLVGKLVFADLPVYFWFIVSVLFLGGTGSAFWHGATDEATFLKFFAMGVGAGILLLAIGFPGRLLVAKKHRNAGHIVGTAIAALVLFLVFMDGFPLDHVFSLTASFL